MEISLFVHSHTKYKKQKQTSFKMEDGINFFLFKNCLTLEHVLLKKHWQKYVTSENSIKFLKPELNSP